MVAVRRALLWLHLGDVEAARGCVGGGDAGGERVQERVVEALCDMADGECEAALEKCELFFFFLLFATCDAWVGADFGQGRR